MAFSLISSPYTHNQRSTSRIMLLVIIALIPGIVTQSYFFGWGNLVQLILAGITAIISEAIILRLRQQPILITLLDNSALLTAMLLAVSIPSLAPWWIVVVGTAFSIIIAKQLYGGLGQNPFNPAMVGYVMLLISFPVPMTSWLPPTSIQSIPNFFDTLSLIFHNQTLQGATVHQVLAGIDGITQATPLDNFKTGLSAGHPAETLLAQSIYHGVIAGLGWQWVNVAFLLGGLALLAKHIIRWQIPIAMLLALSLCALLGWMIAPEKLVSPILHLFSGGTMLGVFFIATDPVSASTTDKGRLLYGALIGVLIWLIRSFGGYPDGVAFAVLLANICVPLIDYYTQPRVYGQFGEK